MIVKSCSSDRQDDVSVIDRGDGFSEVWLRRNHAQDAADNGPEGPATTFWTCDEVGFVARGQTSVAEVTARFDELWEAHRDDGRPAEEVAAEARAASADTLQAVGELGVDSAALQQSTAEILQAIGELGAMVAAMSAGEPTEPTE